MIISPEGLALIKEYEGLRLKAYRDAVGVLTIGWGHTGKDVREGMTITQNEAEELLRIDLQKFEAAVKRLVKVQLTQSQFDALVSFTFNLGEYALERSTLLELLNKGQFAAAGDQFGRWVNAGGKPLPGLVRRRAAEADLFNQP
jgi:lysozyme